MSFQVPQNKCSLDVKDLGRLDGWHYADGVQQYCGIPYADLQKRWTRSVLKTSWPNEYHDGTQLGNNCPRPRVSDSDSNPTNPFIPVPANPTFTRQPVSDEQTALVLNVSTAHSLDKQNQKLPVVVFVHGGSLLFGSSNYGIYDTLNLASHSKSVGLPLVIVSMNYRLGLGGFLACSKIGEELKQDGFTGNGNFGFTDQVVATEWVQKYIANFGGDPDNVTVVGQSAGGVSIGHHLASNHPMKFHRAVCMSGLGLSLRAITLEGHEKLFDDSCRYFKIDPYAPDALDQLRKVDQQVLADADPHIQGVPAGTGNPCLDGWFYAHDPQQLTEAPAWLKSFMVGDVHDEGVIFIMNLMKDSYGSVRNTIMKQVGDEKFVDAVFQEYEITSDLPHKELIERVCFMAADCVFKKENYETAIVNKRLRDEGALFKYHFDQRSRIHNALFGRAYHGIDILYLFRNFDTAFNAEERVLAGDLQTAWIRFAYGEEPWQKDTDASLWKVWGPDSKQKVETEAQDDAVRHYDRFKRLETLGAGGLWAKYFKGLDSLIMKRDNEGKF
ncbi:acetylcholinesterase [Penicillium angulare]|uniref:acetylcholinesterase n=1 Tax=Penicillium angulare TaxID=116970 RepID=UPI0025420B39|nr:acetylcholinesterase [Penicillium angulare]KAJ5279784.1 acetylcholinesterase [Penicillium angulare]